MTSKPIIFRHRIGWLGLALVPLLLTGLAAVYVGVSIQFLGTITAKPGAGWAVLLLGLLAMVFAVGALSMHWDLEIDRPAGQVRRTRGTLGMKRSYAYDLKFFDRVTVTHHLLTTHNGGSYSRFRVSLSGKDISVYVTEYSTKQQAADKAGDIAIYLDLPTEICDEA
ncbi:hypothetical protein [Humisphaera borealis]|uniref:Uncharacterized protein n=1 Tax=Humisphaera borealis TaxID=2807512 RepID=A0A7M2WYK4_9BACT|nr:hypothetical protein [Humisphaera borealis]QOV90302.1 hypothetical protein IPV69_02710 [Humisphaera borealis]